MILSMTVVRNCKGMSLYLKTNSVQDVMMLDINLFCTISEKNIELKGIPIDNCV